MLVLDTKNTIESPFKQVTIPAGIYAIANYKGDIPGLANFYMDIYLNWLPLSGYEPDDYPLMERYVNDALVDGYSEIEVFIKLVKSQ